MFPFAPALVLASLPLDPGSPLAAARQARILAEMRRRCADRGLLVMLDGEDDGPFKRALDQAGQDPRFVGWMDATAFCEPRWDTGEMAALAQREGWALAPGWALLDRDARVVARGSRPPGVEALWKAIEGLGTPSMEVLLDRFLEGNPERADAWQARFDLAYRRAVLGLRNHLAPAPPERPRLKGDLDPDLDRRLWDDCARALDKVARANGWKPHSGNPEGQFLVAGRYYALSPTMGEAVRRLKPHLLDTLARYPTSVPLWTFFLTLDEAEPVPSLAALLDTLSPGPECAAWPPPGPAFRLMEEAEAQGAWGPLAAARRDRLDQALAEPVEGWGAVQTEKRRRIVWEGALLPYLEMLLRQGEEGKAEAALARTLAWSHGRDEAYVRMAVELAERCGRADAAERFPRVRPAAPKAEKRPPSRSRLEVLEAFHRLHPDQREVATELLQERLANAGRRTPPGSAPLDEAADERLWGAASRQLAAFYLDETFRLAPLVLEVPEPAHRSALFRAAATRARDLLEVHLLRDPRWAQDWRNWIALNRIAGPARTIRSLLERCPPLPGGSHPLPLPALLQGAEEARKRGDWTTIVDLIDPMWEDVVRTWAPPFPQPPASGAEAGRRLRDAQALLGPLVEAQLKLRKAGEADDGVRRILGLLPHRDLARMFSRHAAAAGRPDLARTWAALAP